MQALMIGRSIALLVAGGVALSACDENTTNKGERCVSSLGLDFVRVFSQDATAEPVDVGDLDFELTPRREPFDVPC